MFWLSLFVVRRRRMFSPLIKLIRTTCITLPLFLLRIFLLPVNRYSRQVPGFTRQAARDT